MSSTFRPATTTDAEHDWKEVFNFPTATSSTSVWSAFPHPSQSSWTISLNQEPPRVVPRGLRQSANAEDVLSEFENFQISNFQPAFLLLPRHNCPYLYPPNYDGLDHDRQRWRGNLRDWYPKSPIPYQSPCTFASRLASRPAFVTHALFPPHSCLAHPPSRRHP